jgi:hypothetical protein
MRIQDMHTYETEQPALDIIIQWIDFARRKKMVDHLKAFWRVRDIIENAPWSKPFLSGVLLFLHTRCKASPEREIVVNAVLRPQRGGKPAVLTNEAIKDILES